MLWDLKLVGFVIEECAGYTCCSAGGLCCCRQWLRRCHVSGTPVRALPLWEGGRKERREGGREGLIAGLGHNGFYL